MWAALDHQEEAVRVLLEDLDRLPRHVLEVRLVREGAVDRRVAEPELVEGDAHVVEVEEAEEAGGAAGGGVAVQRRRRLDEGVAVGLELVDDVPLVGPARAGLALRDEVVGAATEEDLELRRVAVVEELAGDESAVAAVLGLGEERRRGGVGEEGVGDDAGHLSELPVDEHREVLEARVVVLGRRVVGEDPLHAVVRLVSRRVVVGARGGVGDEGVEGGGHQEAVERELVHRQRGVGLPLRVPLREDAGGRPVGRAHPVADQEDDVLRLVLGACREGIGSPVIGRVEGSEVELLDDRLGRDEALLTDAIGRAGRTRRTRRRSRGAPGPPPSGAGSGPTGGS